MLNKKYSFCRRKNFAFEKLLLCGLLALATFATQGEDDYPAGTVFFDVAMERLGIKIPGSKAILDLKIGPGPHESNNELEITWKCKGEAPIKKTFATCNADLQQIEFANGEKETQVKMNLYTAANFQLRDQETYDEGKKKKDQRKKIRMTCFPNQTSKPFTFPLCP